MAEILANIDGYKTYIGASIAGVAGFCLIMGWITQETFESLLAIAGGVSIYGLRSAMKKMEK